MEIIWIVSLVGAVIGISISIYFGVYDKNVVDIYSRSFFGITYKDFAFYLVILLAIPLLMTLITLSVIIRDLDYPNNLPFNFTVETLMMALLPAIGILIMPKLRGYSYTSKTAFEFSLAVLRFGIIHILLQFSGFWSDLFPYLHDKDMKNTNILGYVGFDATQLVAT